MVLTMSQYHRDAVAALLANDWHGVHKIVMQYNDPLACWIHALLHKMEGDTANSRHWYAQTTHDYADFADPRAELMAIKQAADET